MMFEALKERIHSIPQVAAWPEMLALVDRVACRETLAAWDYPVAACEAVGGSPHAALPGAAAVLCSLLSIHLVDDMLDEDPRGDYHSLGNGQAANLALAFQAAAHRLLDEAPADPQTRSALQATLGRMTLATAFGQHLDARDLHSEEEYWRVVDAKTPPLFGAAFHVGALLGGAPLPVAGRLEQVGQTLGRFVQVSDDLSDALQSPACADWQRRSNNLAILYAMTADHPERESFLQLSARSGDPEALDQAQRILLRSGAVSYCIFRMLESYKGALDLVGTTPLPAPDPVLRLLTLHRRPLDRLLESVGVEQPAELSLV